MMETTPQTSKRLFIAIAAHQGLDQTAEQILKKLKIGADRGDFDIRWVHPENYHITLVFLGKTPIDRIPDIVAGLRRAAEQQTPFQLKVEDVGAFPDEFSARVLWYGVQNSRALRALQDRVAQEMRDLGLPLEDRAYEPHLTIARLRNPRSTKNLISPFVRKKIGRLQVGEIVLYESVGSVPFPTYQALEKLPLIGNGEKIDIDPEAT